MENISLKLEKDFLRLVEKIMKRHNYMTKTEFIREAIRDKISELEEKEKGKTRPSVAELEKETAGHTHHVTGSERKELPSYI